MWLPAAQLAGLKRRITPSAPIRPTATSQYDQPRKLVKPLPFDEIGPKNEPIWSRLTHDLTPYVPGEQPRIADLVKLNTNESPFGPSPRVLEAIRAAATR